MCVLGGWGQSLSLSTSTELLGSLWGRERTRRCIELPDKHLSLLPMVTVIVIAIESWLAVQERGEIGVMFAQY